MKRAKEPFNLYLAGALALLLVCTLLLLSKSGASQKTVDCAACGDLAVLKELEKHGQVSQRQSIDRRLAILDADWQRRRLTLLRKKEEAVAAEHKSGNATLGELLETKVEVARARLVVKDMPADGFANLRVELLSAYGKWLEDQAAAGSLSADERRHRLERFRQRLE